MGHIKYRPEIDGLRSVAVMLVVFYHAGISYQGKELFSGGFIGVDIFFVISGYLISKIIFREINSNTFSIMNFYERRARRIIPALTVVLLITSYFCWKILLPQAFIEFGKSLFSTVAFIANIFFWRQDSYNAEISSLKPLLHMWSLGVEEQFYLFYPILIILVVKSKKSITKTLLFIGVASLSLCEWMSFTHKDFNFYMLPTRAWELIAGGLIVQCDDRIRQYEKHKMTIEYILSFSLAVIFIFSIHFTDNSRLPSLINAVLIFSVTFIIAFAKSDTFIGKILSNKIFVSIGLISYSLYLWHQPVLSLLRVELNRGLTNEESFLAIFTCLILSIISYLYVETPFRNKMAINRKTVFSGTLLACTLLSMFGILIFVEKGFPSRFKILPMFMSDVNYGLESQKDHYISLAKSNGAEIRKNPFCYILNKSGKYTLITLGDSHIETLNAPIINQHKSIPFISKFVPLTSSASLFILNIDRADNIDNPNMTRDLINFNQNRLERVLGYEKPVIITGGRLPLLLENERFDNELGGCEYGNDHPGLVIKTKTGYRKANFEEIASAYCDTIKKLLNNGCKVVLVYPIPEVGWDVPNTLLRKTINMSASELKIFISKKSNLATRYSVFCERTKASYAILDRIQDNPNLIRVFPEQLFCDDSQCYTYNNVVYYRDDDHLSYPGAKILLHHIVKKIYDNWPDLRG
ncbi:acyltransferase family protein [Pseudodesulfovibrio cashew]|uniref:Acyltransferase family protein n=1 Tax=Pseudodesulfovibrio cashew TaxID=2678688 RepID=A0A6I6JIX2_9BACT|nr:acyltransferase family protein [Pseudodesulfovibrio cashew]QGY41089.1 acyltransferase family protein [Pseudodesulfovibrio cashew]